MANKSNSTVADVEIAESGNATAHDGGLSRLEQLDEILDAFAPPLQVRSFVPTMGIA
jgi:hypothetical protein